MHSEPIVFAHIEHYRPMQNDVYIIYAIYTLRILLGNRVNKSFIIIITRLFGAVSDPINLFGNAYGTMHV